MRTLLLTRPAGARLWRLGAAALLAGALGLGVGCHARQETWHGLQAHLASHPPHVQASPEVASLDTLARQARPVELAPGYRVGDGAAVGPGFDLFMRNPDFPRTYIAAVHLDVTSPYHYIRLQWAGPMAAQGPVGPWRTTPGRGNPGMNCDDEADSNTVDSRCTPKGVFRVAGFADRLNSVPTCLYATWVVHAPRYIALHSHTDLPRRPVSSGCVRMSHEAAKLIHNNSIAGVTLVSITGRWTRPPQQAARLGAAPGSR